jgi:chromosome segregation ATPase
MSAPASTAAPPPATPHPIPATSPPSAKLQSQLAATAQERDQLAATLEAQRAQAQAMDSQLAESQHDAAGRNAALTEARNEVASLKTKLRRVGSYVDKLKAADEEKLRRTQAVARDEAHKVAQFKESAQSLGTRLSESEEKVSAAHDALVAAEHERDAAIAELRTFQSNESVATRREREARSEVEAEKATTEQLRGYLQQQEEAAVDLQHQLAAAQADAAKNKKLEAERAEALKTKWSNFTSSVQEVLRKQDDGLDAARKEKERIAAQLTASQQSEARLRTQLADVAGEAERMQSALSKQGSGEESLKREATEAETAARAAEARADAADRRARALASSLAAAKAQVANATSAYAAAQAQAKTADAAATAAAQAAPVALADAEASLRTATSRANAESDRAVAAESQVKRLQNVTAEDARLLRAAASQLRKPRSSTQQNELLGELSHATKKLRQAVTGWKKSKVEVHSLQLKIRSDETEMAQLRTLVAEQQEQIKEAGLRDA